MIELISAYSTKELTEAEKELQLLKWQIEKLKFQFQLVTNTHPNRSLQKSYNELSDYWLKDNKFQLGVRYGQGKYL